MSFPDFEQALSRLECAPWRSSTTDAALTLLRQKPSDALLVERLASPATAPAALEVLSALQAESEAVYEAVRERIRWNPCLSWCLVESLNRLPWYDGMRAFLCLPDAPVSSPSAYCFYMLARNKVFIPTDVRGPLYDYYVQGLWRMLPVARSEDWHAPHHSVLAIVELIRTHLEKPAPDAFVVYFAVLLLGRMAPLEDSIEALKGRVNGNCHPTVRIVAALALIHLKVEGAEEMLGNLASGSGTGPSAHSSWIRLSTLRKFTKGSPRRRLSFG